MEKRPFLVWSLFVFFWIFCFEKLDVLFWRLYDAIKEEKENIFNSASKDYREVLKVYNYKQLSYIIEEEFGLSRDTYRNLVIRHLKGDKGQQIVDALKRYMPTEIPN